MRGDRISTEGVGSVPFGKAVSDARKPDVAKYGNFVAPCRSSIASTG